MSERQFPILRDYLDHGDHPRAKSIPWELIASHEEQAMRNHGGQTLKRLAERGGLAVNEAVAVLQDREWREMPSLEAETELARLVADFSQPPPTSAPAKELTTEEVAGRVSILQDFARKFGPTLKFQYAVDAAMKTCGPMTHRHILDSIRSLCRWAAESADPATKAALAAAEASL